MPLSHLSGQLSLAQTAAQVFLSDTPFGLQNILNHRMVKAIKGESHERNPETVMAQKDGGDVSLQKKKRLKKFKNQPQELSANQWVFHLQPTFGFL